tara:strand:+ start:31 stop:366 length:336 start_codon:yes stop_codon:yes gene_type:complete
MFNELPAICAPFSCLVKPLKLGNVMFFFRSSIAIASAFITCWVVSAIVSVDIASTVAVCAICVTHVVVGYFNNRTDPSLINKSKELSMLKEMPSLLGHLFLFFYCWMYLAV